MHDETQQQDVAAEEFSAAAPPDPEGPGLGETNFADAEAPPAGKPKPKAEQDEAAKYLELAKRTQADFENYRKRMARENAAAGERGAAKLAKELLPALDHLEIALKAAEGLVVVGVARHGPSYCATTTRAGRRIWPLIR